MHLFILEHPFYLIKERVLVFISKEVAAHLLLFLDCKNTHFSLNNKIFFARQLGRLLMMQRGRRNSKS